jgi:hypothetical protein
MAKFECCVAGGCIQKILVKVYKFLYTVMVGVREERADAYKEL